MCVLWAVLIVYFTSLFQALTINEVCGSTPSGEDVKDYEVICEDPPMLGQYVTIQMKGSHFFDIAEVELKEY